MCVSCLGERASHTFMVTPSSHFWLQDASFEGRAVRDTATGVPFGYAPPTVFSAALQVRVYACIYVCMCFCVCVCVRA